MKKFISASLALIVCGAFLSCSKKNDPGDPASVIDALIAAKNYDQRIKLFSSKSAALISNASRTGTVPGDGHLAALPFMSGKMKWRELHRKPDGDLTVIKIVISSHESENLIGSELTIAVVKESGDWKIDLSKELSGVKKSGMGAEDYIRRLKNQ